MSTSQQTSALIASLEAGRATGRLTIESADGRMCRVYVLICKVFYAKGPAGEGEPALTDARSWPDVTQVDASNATWKITFTWLSA